MISKKTIKEFASYRQAKKCKEENVFIVEGVKLVQELLESDHTIIELCATENWISSHSQMTFPFPIHLVSESSLERISLMQSPNQVWAMVQRREDLSAEKKTPFFLLLDQIKDPGNMGSLIRTADWFNFPQIICSPDCVDSYNPKVVQASMGAIFRISIRQLDLTSFIQDHKHLPVFGALLKGENVYEHSLSKEGILIIGNESKGISKELIPLITTALTIPQFGGKTESLNASVAAGILCSEFRRRYP